MKEFHFLLDGRAVPPEMQILSQQEERKSNIISALQERSRLEISIRDGRIVTASSLFLKLIKKDDDLFIMIDTLVPGLSEDALLSSKTAIIGYRLDNIACGFLSQLVLYQKATRTFIMTFPDRIYRLQRRMYFRVGITLNRMVKISADHLEKKDSLTCHDLSEGGVSFYASEEHQFLTGNEYTVSLLFFNGAVVQARLIVRNVIDNPNNRTCKLRVCCEFYQLNTKNREIISKYVFMRQMEEIQKTRGE